MFNIYNYVKEFDDHRTVSFICDPKTNMQGFIAIHRGNGNKIPAFGATRFVQYKNIVEGLQDALRLSRLMSYKSALAGLTYGGAKGVIFLPSKPFDKKAVLKSYCQKINLLNGHFITGADVGISASEVKAMHQESPFIVGIKVDPVKFTVLGITHGLDICLNEIFGSGDTGKRSFAIQGVGKIGSGLLKLLYPHAKKIFIADVDKEQLKKIRQAYPKTSIVSPEEIYKQKVDVFMPCALGNSLNAKTIAKIKAPIILGGANNQLTNSAVGELLFKLGILYAPDYVVNAGGLISVVDEYEHKNVDTKRIERRLHNIRVILHSILKQSKSTGTPTNLIADQMAEKIFNNH